MHKYITHKNKIKKNLNPESFLLNTKLLIPRWSLENFSGKYYNMKDKILGFQSEPMFIKRTHPSYSDGNDPDKAGTQHDRWRRQEWCNWEKCKNMQTSLECVCFHEILEVKVFHLEGKPDSSGIELLRNFCKICVYFLVVFFSEIS